MKWSLSGSEGRREKPSGENSIYKGPESEKPWLVEASKMGSGWWGNGQGGENGLLKLA